MDRKQGQAAEPLRPVDSTPPMRLAPENYQHAAQPRCVNQAGEAQEVVPTPQVAMGVQQCDAARAVVAEGRSYQLAAH